MVLVRAMNRMTRRLLLVWLAVTVFCVAFVVATLAGGSRWSAATAAVVAVVVLYVLVNITYMVRTTEVVEERLLVRAPLERVHELLADPRDVLRWAPAVVAVEDLVGEPVAVGSRWRVHYVNDLVLASEVVAAEPPFRVLVRSRGVPGVASNGDRYRADPDGRGEGNRGALLAVD
jgi:hypothetical protein